MPRKKLESADPAKVATSLLEDQLEYMADMLAELRDMATSNRLATLAAILELARTEARLRAREAAE